MATPAGTARHRRATGHEHRGGARRDPARRRDRGVRSTRTPRAHWSLLAAVLAVLGLALGLESLAAAVGPSGTQGSAARAGEAGGQPAGATLPRGGPVVARDDAEPGGLAAGAPLPRTVALTFEDGPDPRWTPQVLDALAAEGVRATFLLTGARAAEHPDLVRRIRAEGHEVGVHGWSHTDLASLLGWRRNLELSLSQLALAGADGVVSALLRPPCTGTPEDLSPAQEQTVADAARAGYVVVLADRVTGDEDATRPDEVVAAAGGPQQADDLSPGAVVLLHDGGGDRSATVAAIPDLVERYRDAGWDLTTVSEALGLPASAESEAGALRSAQGDALLVFARVAGHLVGVVTWLVVALTAVALLRSGLVVALARRHVRVAAGRIAGEPYLPPVSVLVPAYDEAVGIAGAVRSLVASDYPDLEVVVVDDGSTDGTGDIVEALGLPGVRVVRQANAGKARALATAARHASHDVLVMLDGDTVFEPATIRSLVQPLRDPAVGAVSGNTKVGNRHGLLGRWQHLEYVSGFNLDRRLQDLLGCITTVPGACGAFRRQALEAAGGVSTDTLAEDTDVTMAVLRAGYRVVHEERARAWTEAPATVQDLWKQRYRWSYGTLQCMWKHRGALTDRRPGGRRLGRVGIPYMAAFQVLMPLLAPAIDLLAVFALLTGEGATVLAVWGGFAALQLVLTAYALRLDGESLRPLWSLPLQQLLYRQLIYLVVLQSIASAVAGARLPWHKLQRTGDVVVPA